MHQPVPGDLHQAQLAATDGLQAGIVAERRDVDPMRLGGVQDRTCAVDLQMTPIDEDAYRRTVLRNDVILRQIGHLLLSYLRFSRMLWQSRTPSIASLVQRSAPT